MKVDSATHVWSTDSRLWRWSPVDRVEIPQAGADADRLVEDLAAAEVDCAVVVQPRAYGPNHEYLVHAVDQHPSRLIPVGLITSRSGPLHQARELVLRWRMRGLRIVVLDEDDPSWIAESQNDSLFEWIAEAAVPVSFLIQPSAIDLVRHRALRTPSGVFIVDHLGLVGPQAVDDLTSLAAAPNIYVKVSAFESLSNQPPPFADLHDLIRATVERFGPERCMWGSDYPHHSQVHNYQQSVTVATTLLSAFDDLARDEILGGTASRLFSISQPKED